MAPFEPSDGLLSWGRVIRARHRVATPRFRDELPWLVAEAGLDGKKGLAVGLGRSYGDSGLNPDGAIIAMRALDRVHVFDEEQGVLRADAGFSLDEAIRLAAPRGLFPPVVPGTRFVTLGGAVANDIHGKNHFCAGTFGRHVSRLMLRRTDGSRIELSPDDETGLFAATLGGLGLTGVIEWVELALKKIPSGFIDAEDIPFGSLDEFFSIADESDLTHEYTVAWVDCTRSGGSLGRGIFSRGNVAPGGGYPPDAPPSLLRIPIEFPRYALNALTLRTFNTLYFALKRARAGKTRVHYAPFFFPLDAIRDWNRLYGRDGMYQYQCVIPSHIRAEAIGALLETIARSGQGSFLAVLKTFGTLVSPGMLSFPREGVTLALDFSNRGAETLSLFDSLDQIVHSAGGRLYPAKDGRIGAAMFASGYPRLPEFCKHLDPGLSSSFWRRVHP
jgi:FAD/FMN-containing dehydrogenase